MAMLINVLLRTAVEPQWSLYAWNGCQPTGFRWSWIDSALQNQLLSATNRIEIVR